MTTFAAEQIPADRDYVARLIGSDGKRLAREVEQAAGISINGDRAEHPPRARADAVVQTRGDFLPIPD